MFAAFGGSCDWSCTGVLWYSAKGISKVLFVMALWFGLEWVQVLYLTMLYLMPPALGVLFSVVYK